MFIETERLHIRTFTLQDAQLLMENKSRFFLEKKINYTKEWPSDGLLAWLPLYVESLEADNQEFGFGPWYTTVRSGTALVGDIGFKAVSFYKEQREISYSVVASKRGRGYAQEAVSALTAWAFNQHISLITAQCDRYNTPSLQVLKKCGYRLYGKEGTILLFKKERNRHE
ncbi:Protein N-acetyltransferase, RimJ/RimL family [Thalassobacillus cyri]|uniref:Protein N-acetyltransferase, RimJ/RimL family n=1 Tax=Thalassobacillus cyri TaxID=571932 RepID=A0A1H4GQ46_9BACI|nr:GNAT family protein [Thalassobacillus cyri]SEB11736.1 Protein N-acetyltransferase, RimJ/RimL family [Thalassobacillus cyri]